MIPNNNCIYIIIRLCNRAVKVSCGAEGDFGFDLVGVEGGGDGVGAHEYIIT